MMRENGIRLITDELKKTRRFWQRQTRVELQTYHDKLSSDPPPSDWEVTQILYDLYTRFQAESKRKDFRDGYKPWFKKREDGLLQVLLPSLHTLLVGDSIGDTRAVDFAMQESPRNRDKMLFEWMQRLHHKFSDLSVPSENLTSLTAKQIAQALQQQHQTRSRFSKVPPTIQVGEFAVCNRALRQLSPLDYARAWYNKIINRIKEAVSLTTLKPFAESQNDIEQQVIQPVAAFKKKNPQYSASENQDLLKLDSKSTTATLRAEYTGKFDAWAQDAVAQLEALRRNAANKTKDGFEAAVRAILKDFPNSDQNAEMRAAANNAIQYIATTLKLLSTTDKPMLINSLMNWFHYQEEQQKTAARLATLNSDTPQLNVQKLATALELPNAAAIDTVSSLKQALSTPRGSAPRSFASSSMVLTPARRIDFGLVTPTPVAKRARPIALPTLVRDGAALAACMHIALNVGNLFKQLKFLVTNNPTDLGKIWILVGGLCRQLTPELNSQWIGSPISLLTPTAKTFVDQEYPAVDEIDGLPEVVSLKLNLSTWCVRFVLDEIRRFEETPNDPQLLFFLLCVAKLENSKTAEDAIQKAKRVLKQEFPLSEMQLAALQNNDAKIADFYASCAESLASSSPLAEALQNTPPSLHTPASSSTDVTFLHPPTPPPLHTPSDSVSTAVTHLQQTPKSLHTPTPSQSSHATRVTRLTATALRQLRTPTASMVSSPLAPALQPMTPNQLRTPASSMMSSPLAPALQPMTPNQVRTPASSTRSSPAAVPALAPPTPNQLRTPASSTRSSPLAQALSPATPDAVNSPTPSDLSSAVTQLGVFSPRQNIPASLTDSLRETQGISP